MCKFYLAWTVQSLATIRFCYLLGELNCTIFRMDYWIDNCLLKPAAHLRKELSKLPREAISSAVSSRVRLSFREFFASRGREENICRVWYLRFRLVRRNSHETSTAHLRKQLSWLPRVASRFLARQFAQLFPQVCGRLKCLLDCLVDRLIN